jgi:hypothetical protein
MGVKLLYSKYCTVEVFFVEMRPPALTLLADLILTFNTSTELQTTSCSRLSIFCISFAPLWIESDKSIKRTAVPNNSRQPRDATPWFRPLLTQNLYTSPSHSKTESPPRHAKLSQHARNILAASILPLSHGRLAYRSPGLPYRWPDLP